MSYYGEFNSHALNTDLLNGGSAISIPIEGFTVLTVSQLVGSVISGTILALSQDVQLNIIILGTIISFAQNVKHYLDSFAASTITQIVYNPAIPDFYSLHGWDVFVSINGNQLQGNQIRGDIVITKQSNQATTCVFNVTANDPYGFLYANDGGAVVINYRDSTGWHRVFTGLIDVPDIDLINKYITLNCSDRRDELVLAQVAPTINTIGRYALPVQGTMTNVADDLSYRLQTVAADVDFDAHNNLNVNSWYAKNTPDFTLTNSNVYYRKPNVSWQSRGGVVNNLLLNINFQYTRLYHYQRQFSWDLPLEIVKWGWAGKKTIAGDDYSAGGGYPFGNNGWVDYPTVDTIKQAISQAKWHDSGFTATTSYSALGFDGPAVLSISGPAFNTLNYTLGTYKAYDTGGTIQDLLYAIAPATSGAYKALAASWSASTRFSQYVQEFYTINVKSTQSINQYGYLPSANQATAPTTYSVQATYDSSNWDNYTDTSGAPSYAVYVGNSYWFNKDKVQPTAPPPGNPFTPETPLLRSDAELANTLLTAIDRAKVQILASHRDTKVSVETQLMPTLELKHTVEIDTDKLACKGKVSRIVHNIAIKEHVGCSTEVELSLFRSRGSATTTPTVAPARPSDSVSIPTSTVVLGSHMGVAPTNSMNGWIGNMVPIWSDALLLAIYNLDAGYITSHGGEIAGSHTKTSYQESFRVDTPSVPESLTKLRVLNSTSTYEVAIPNDPLDMVFE